MSEKAYLIRDVRTRTVHGMIRTGEDENQDLVAAHVDTTRQNVEASLRRMSIAGGVTVDAVDLPFDSWSEAVEEVFGRTWPLPEADNVRAAGNVALRAAAPAVPVSPAPAGSGPRMSAN